MISAADAPELGVYPLSPRSYERQQCELRKLERICNRSRMQTEAENRRIFGSQWKEYKDILSYVKKIY